MLYTREQICEAIANTSPAEIFTAQRREEILNTPYFQTALAQLREKNEKEYAQPIPCETFSAFEGYFSTGSRTAFMSAFTVPRHKLAVHAMSAWLFKDDKALHAAEDALWAILNEYSWAPPFHISAGDGEKNKKNVALETVMSDETYIIDLLAAETANSIAVCLCMLGDRMHPFLVKRARVELERRIFTPFLTRRFVWESKTNNWASVCASNISLAALAVVGDEGRLCAILEKAFCSLENFLSGFSPDGACLEGLGYWNYGFGPYVALAKYLAERTGGKLTLFSFDIVERVSRFYSMCFFKGGRTVSFADSGSYGKYVTFTHSILLGRYPDLRIPSELVSMDLPPNMRLRELAYFFTETTEQYMRSASEVLGTYILPEAQWYISTSENGIGIAAKGGHNDEPHNHNDIGSFEIYKNTAQMIADLGSGEYTLDYFSHKRYECFSPSSRSHSVPIINGQYQKGGAQYCAKEVKIDENGMSLELSGAYGIEELRSLVRNIAFDRKTGTTTLTDSYIFTRVATSVCERLVTSGEARLISDGMVEICSEAEYMYVHYDNTQLTATISKVHDKGPQGVPRVTTVMDFCPKELSCAFTVALSIQSENKKGE